MKQDKKPCLWAAGRKGTPRHGTSFGADLVDRVDLTDRIDPEDNHTKQVNPVNFVNPVKKNRHSPFFFAFFRAS